MRNIFWKLLRGDAMIRIGLSPIEQCQVLDAYVHQHAIQHAVIFSPDAFPFAWDGVDGVSHEYVRYTDIIEYAVFYRLLEIIHPQTLLVFHECLRTQKRSDLTYNCAHHYAHQTPHVIAFEHFPMIEQPDDLMILLDYQSPGKYKGRSYRRDLLMAEDIRHVPHHFCLETIALKVSLRDQERYEQRKEDLFAHLGQGDPDTIPRQLHVFAGSLKKGAIEPFSCYAARNDRWKLANVRPYKHIQTPGDYTIVDFPHRRIDFNDFLKRTAMTTIRFLHSGLKVDHYYWDEMRRWVDRLEEMYACMDVFQALVTEEREALHA